MGTAAITPLHCTVVVWWGTCGLASMALSCSLSAGPPWESYLDNMDLILEAATQSGFVKKLFGDTKGP